MDTKYQGYGFARHKGYGSAAHINAIKLLGPSPIHRLTFGGVKEYVDCPSF
jgi:ribonuclease HII